MNDPPKPNFLDTIADTNTPAKFPFDNDYRYDYSNYEALCPNCNQDLAEHSEWQLVECAKQLIRKRLGGRLSIGVS